MKMCLRKLVGETTTDPLLIHFFSSSLKFPLSFLRKKILIPYVYYAQMCIRIKTRSHYRKDNFWWNEIVNSLNFYNRTLREGYLDKEVTLFLSIRLKISVLKLLYNFHHLKCFCNNEYQTKVEINVTLFLNRIVLF